MFAPPAFADDPADPAVAAALARINDGTYTQADIDLIKTDPVLADEVPDPSTNLAAMDVSGGDASPVYTIDATSCWHVTVTVRRRSLLGSTLYKWHHYVEWCGTSSGKKVTKWRQRYDYVTNASSVVYVRELNAESHSSTPVYNVATSFRQRHIEYCVVKYGCYTSHYPHSKIWVYWWGGYAYTASNA
ncbi:hypothetical protein [Dactylosporangium sp. CA-139066]|uniref:hypothetical protein n=1 Tax=Dactylosporangium sp. CA-139066 TaxID=3239930 RepID=UPI003D948436